MGIYDYKHFSTPESKALVSDAMAIMLYSYHNLDNGFAAGYQHNGFGVGLPATLVTALLGGSDSQGVIPGVPWNPDSEKLALQAVQKAGWTPIGASQLGYTGKVDGRGTFFGEKAGYTTAQIRRCGAPDGDWCVVSWYQRSTGGSDRRFHWRHHQRRHGSAGAQGLCKKLRG